MPERDSGAPNSDRPSNGRAVARRPIEPMEALRGIRILLNDPDDTGQVFRIIRALSGDAFERLFWRVVSDPVGRQVLERERPLLEVLSDRDGLKRCPEGSLGRAYLAFVEREQITADGLVEASNESPFDDAVFYDKRAQVLGDRLRDMHDLWHVVTGYSRDLVGEGALLAFTYAQTRNRGIGFIVAAGASKLYNEGHSHAPKAMWQGYLRGRRAGLLPAADWEALLERPLDEVRRSLGIDDPPDYGEVYGGEAAEFHAEAA